MLKTAIISFLISGLVMLMLWAIYEYAPTPPYCKYPLFKYEKSCFGFTIRDKHD